MQVRLLWGDSFRVNVLAGDDYLTAKIIHSYFITADSDGRILASVPALEKQY